MSKKIKVADVLAVLDAQVVICLATYEDSKRVRDALIADVGSEAADRTPTVASSYLMALASYRTACDMRMAVKIAVSK